MSQRDVSKVLQDVAGAMSKSPREAIAAAARQIANAHSLQASIVVSDQLGRILWVNHPFEKLCGYKLAEMKSKRPESLLRGKETSATAIQMMTDSVKKRCCCSVEVVNYHKDGHPYSVHIEIAPVLVRDACVGFAAVECEIPTALELQRRLKRRLQALLRSIKAEPVRFGF